MKFAERRRYIEGKETVNIHSGDMMISVPFFFFSNTASDW